MQTTRPPLHTGALGLEPPPSAIVCEPIQRGHGQWSLVLCSSDPDPRPILAWLAAVAPEPLGQATIADGRVLWLKIRAPPPSWDQLLGPHAGQRLHVGPTGEITGPPRRAGDADGVEWDT